MAESSPNGRKHCGQKEKLLVTSNFSFSHSVFKRLVLQTRTNQGLFGRGLINNIRYDCQLQWLTSNSYLPVNVPKIHDNAQHCVQVPMLSCRCWIFSKILVKKRGELCEKINLIVTWPFCIGFPFDRELAVQV